MWAIYYDHELPSGVRTETCVLLEDGAFTEQANCYMREFDVVWHTPRLFVTRGGASNWKKTRLDPRRCYRIAKYTGPTEPWDRDNN